MALYFIKAAEYTISRVSANVNCSWRLVITCQYWLADCNKSATGMQELSSSQLYTEEITSWRLYRLLCCIQIKVLQKIKPVPCCFKNISSLMLRTVSLDKYKLETFCPSLF